MVGKRTVVVALGDLVGEVHGVAVVLFEQTLLDMFPVGFGDLCA